MFFARLHLPENYTDHQINAMGEGCFDPCLSFSAFRQGSHKGPWILEWMMTERPEESFLSAGVRAYAGILGLSLPETLQWDCTPVPDQDWLSHTYRQFPPFVVGPFFIYGSHYEGDVSAHQIGLQIDAATAFGSGEHGTTKGCLEAMLDLKAQGHCPWNVLDMGTGSGILAIAAWKLWKSPVLAVDNDPECIRVTAHHVALNGVTLGASALTAACGEGFQEETTQKRKPYELIIANILAGPLKEMAPDVRAVSDENGMVILSGILNEQAEEVLACYEAQGFSLRKKREIGDWTTLILRREV